ncbi:hypothetical protein J3T65_09045 [Staphylococcus simiae]|uniref:DUF1129 family protein n=1 Tax=Staphylococcus simiae TaxID=308354 RepID=UPI001A969FFE|nr:DUF1129 family protein [Staphylococcus simiae]MBO1198852.1 hypothetical protein [Staphylococcus simiae]MBO1201049.1 hypothetical protein [Staphylococcus simiae]MBO1204030.1 hypothetical protein [Staphylococcus simiae]MBO1211089.1 hypothetical protein [Staphylococcus simiae]MBO1229358.1 hypothetical protein [Staphylococcus simiae]
MKSTAQLTKENNVKSLRLSNTDREIFENYMTYVRSDFRVNPYDTELMINKILKQLLSAEQHGLLALDFFNHDPKAHAKKELKALPNETFRNIFKYIFQHIILLIGIVSFLKGFLGFFMEKNGATLYLYAFPFSVLIGLIIVYLFIWISCKTIQLQCFNNSNWVWIFTYLVIILLIVGFFYVFFIPQSLLAFGPHVKVSNWLFILLSFIIIPLGLYIENHVINKHTNTFL